MYCLRWTIALLAPAVAVGQVPPAPPPVRIAADKVAQPLPLGVFLARRKMAIMAADGNRDRKIDRAEWATRRDPRVKDPMKQFPKWDLNHDGVVTADEIDRKLRAMAAGADANHDGALDPAERAALHHAKGADATKR